MLQTHWRHVFLMVPLIAVIAGFSYGYAQVSEHVTVTATVPAQPPLDEPDTIIIFRGIAYPSSTVKISQDGSVISVLTSNTQAQFDVPAIVNPGTYTFTIVGIDSQGIEGKVSNFTLTLSKSTTTTISGIFLGPTITRDLPSIEAGETETVSGTTVPNSEVNVTLTSPGGEAAIGNIKVAVVIASADTNGRWQKLFNADDLVVGVHEAKAQAIEPLNLMISEFSKTVSFEVLSTGQPDQCAGRLAADINCDGFVNLVDFSIMLFYWQQTSPANARADINADNIVNLIDFSIMLFYWTS
ncbi:MAG: dockerin type I domain-containing protein [Parcubacteria group bacterium]